MRVTTKNIATLIASFMIVSCVGCASTLSDRNKSKPASLFERMPWANKDKGDDQEPYPNPVKMAATWSPDTLMQSGRMPTRGFGGRLFFYDEKSRTVPVDGTLVVHGFDEEAANPAEGVKRFEFTPEQFTKHFSNSDLGASYSIWIPWDAVGGERKRISLVASFKTAEGKPVQGSPAMVMLPGAEPSSDADRFARKLAPEYKRYKDALASNKAPRSGLTTTTITRRRLTPEINRSPISLPVGTTPAASMIARNAKSGSTNSGAATAKTTPSAEIAMFGRPQTPDIMPASGELPSSGKSNVVTAVQNTPAATKSTGKSISGDTEANNAGSSVPSVEIPTARSSAIKQLFGR